MIVYLTYSIIKSPNISRLWQKPHRLLPQNLYVVLYNFTARQSDELDLR